MITLTTFVQSLGKRITPIAYGSSEDEDKSKLADYECTRYPSQCKTEQTQGQFFLPVSNLCFNIAFVVPKLTIIATSWTCKIININIKKQGEQIIMSSICSRTKSISKC